MAILLVLLLLLLLLLRLGPISGGGYSEHQTFGDDAGARNLQSLEQLWFLSEIDSNVEIREEESAVDITFLFTTSDFIEDNMIKFDILDAETCSLPILPLEQNDTLLFNDIFSVTRPVSTDATGIGFGSRDWAAEVGVIVPDDLFDIGASNNNTSSTTLVVNGTDLLTFCVRISTALPPGDDDVFSGVRVTQVALVAQIDHDSLSVELVNFDFPPITLPSPSPRAKAAFCDQDNNELGTQPLILPGDFIRICVFPPEDGDYTMGTVDYFQYEELVFQQPNLDDNNNNSTVNSTAVQEIPYFQEAVMPGGMPSSNGLSDFFCTAKVCVIQSILFAGFFEPNTKILASGYATFYATQEDIGNTTVVVGEGDEDNEVLGSDLVLRFETLLQITNVLPTTSPPTTAPSATPTPTFSSTTWLPSQIPSTAPSSMPSSSVSSSSSASWNPFTTSSYFSWMVTSLFLPPFFVLML